MPWLQKLMSPSWIFTIAVTLIGAWFAQHLQNTAKSISIQVVSKTPLLSSTAPEMQSLEILLNGKKLVSPYLSSVQIVNDGGLPITADDIKSQLGLRVAEGTSIVNAIVTAKKPNELEPIIHLAANSFSMQPTLLNPGDSVSIAVTTSGNRPEFITFGRIAGISEIAALDNSTKGQRPMIVLIYAIASFLLFTCVCLLGIGASEVEGTFELRRRALAVGAIASVLGFSFAFDHLSDAMGQPSMLSNLGAYLSIAVLGGAFATWLNWKKN